MLVDIARRGIARLRPGHRSRAQGRALASRPCASSLPPRRGLAAAAAAARSASPLLASNKVLIGVGGLAVFTFGASMYYQEWYGNHDHPAVEEALGKLNASRLFTAPTDDGVIRVGGACGPSLNLPPPLTQTPQPARGD